MSNSIFISIASYRDPQLIPTIQDCIVQADHPENLKFGIAWQHCKEDIWDDMNIYLTDIRFKILDIDYKETKGTCWARNKIQSLYDNEDYYLQLDSHHRFIKGWDTKCIEMIQQLKEAEYKKPLLTTYLPQFDPDNDPAGRVQQPWWMIFDRFIPEGAVFFLPTNISNWEHLKLPIPSRFLSAHFIFTLGQWCKEVIYDPEYYFHGEEISLAVRSFTYGYDLFHPHQLVVWHEYTRKGRTKQWDDDKTWGEKNIFAHKKNRALFAVDSESRNGFDFTGYDFGVERTLQQYEAYAGIRFRDRGVQKYTLNHNIAPNPVITSPLDYDTSFLHIFKHCIDLKFESVPLEDYDFWCIAFEDEKGNTIYRQDAMIDEIKKLKNDSEGYCKIWREFNIDKKPKRWVVWPHSVSKGWCEKLTSEL